MDGIILSIIISTCNRAALLSKNLNRMLKCDIESIEFIVGDNASSDNTLLQLHQIKDNRVKIYHNEINLGFENFWVLSKHAQGKYFMFVNDRDFISVLDIKELCKKLIQIKEVDFVSNEKRDYKSGYYSWEDAQHVYFQSRHPGTLVYNKNFCERYIDTDIIKKLLIEKEAEKANNYLVLQILLNVKNIFVNTRNFIKQPLNRERISQVRKEYHKGTYVSLEYRVSEYNGWICAIEEHRNHPRIRAFLLAVYKDSLMTVTWEYYISLKIPGFKKRVKMDENHSPSEWIKNGILFTWYVMNLSNLKVLKLRWVLLKESLNILYYVTSKILKY